MSRLAPPSLMLSILCLITAPAQLFAEDEPPAPPAVFKHQVTGLFAPDRVDDLRDLAATWPDIELISVDYKKAEAEFRYDPAIAFNGAKPEQALERFANLMRTSSRGTFGIKPLCQAPEKLTLLKIGVAGHDCKGCNFGAYNAVIRVEGVELATASFRDGVVLAWIHADQTDRETLEQALEKIGVALVSP